MPRDREGTFEPRLIAKHERRFTGFDDKILALYARRMTVREIQGFLAKMYGVEVPLDLISTVTFESDWKPPMGGSLIAALQSGSGERRLDIGCVAAHGMFTCDAGGSYTVTTQGKAATAFLLELIAGSKIARRFR